MQLYMASFSQVACNRLDLTTAEIPRYALETVVYFWERPGVWRFVTQAKRFMLDSGAFTFMNSASDARVDWHRFATRYAEFVVNHTEEVDYFMELDLDSVIGLQAVEKLRATIERITGRQPIPVWHISRGKDYFIGMCKDYPYVALGGIAAGHWPRRDFKYFPWFIDTAHKHGAKIHALGMTSMSVLESTMFDSVDSSSWNLGGVYGNLYQFVGDGLKMIHSPENRRRKHAKYIIRNNYKAWLAYQKFLDTGVTFGEAV